MDQIVTLIRIDLGNGGELIEASEAVERILAGSAKLAINQDEPPWELVRRLGEDVDRIERFGPRLSESEDVRVAFDALFDGSRLKPSVVHGVARRSAVDVRDRILDQLTGLRGFFLFSQLTATVEHHTEGQPLRRRMSPSSLRKYRGLPVAPIADQTFRSLQPVWKDFKSALEELSADLIDAGCAGVSDDRILAVNTRGSVHQTARSVRRNELRSASFALWFTSELLAAVPREQKSKNAVVDEIASWMVAVVENFSPERQVTSLQLRRIAKSLWRVKEQWCAEAAQQASNVVQFPQGNFPKHLKVDDQEIRDLMISRKFSGS